MFDNKKLHNALIKVAARKVVYDALVAGMTGPMEKRARRATVAPSQFNVPKAGDEKIRLLPKWYNFSNFKMGLKGLTSPSLWRSGATGKAIGMAAGDVGRFGKRRLGDVKIIGQAATGTHATQRQMRALKKTDPSKYNKIRSDLGMSGNQGYLSRALGDTYSPFRESDLTRGAGFYKRNPWTAVDHAATASAFLPVGAVAGGAVKGTHLAAKGLMNAPRAIGAGIQGLKGLGAGAKGLGAGAKMKAVGSGLKAGWKRGTQWLGNSPSLPWNRAMGGWSIQAPNAPSWLKTLGTMTTAAPLVSKSYKPISKLPWFPGARNAGAPLAKGVQGPLGKPLTGLSRVFAPNKAARLGWTALAGSGVAEAAHSVSQGKPLNYASTIMNAATAAPGWIADKTVGAGARAFVNQMNRSREARRNFAATRGGAVAPTRGQPRRPAVRRTPRDQQAWSDAAYRAADRYYPVDEDTRKLREALRRRRAGGQ